MNHIRHNPQFPLILSAYTINSHLGDYYKRAAYRFTKSMLKFDLPHIIYPLKGCDKWLANCALKPTVILYALQTFKQPILWIDIDGEALQMPKIFNDISADLALYNQNRHWLSGTLYITPNLIEFVRQWKNMTTSTDPDEVTLLKLYNQTSPKPKLQILPATYNTVVHSKTNLSDIVIGHYIRPDTAEARGVTAIDY